VHPEIFTAYLDGELAMNVQREISDELRDSLKGHSPEEAAVLAFLQERLARKSSGAMTRSHGLDPGGECGRPRARLPACPKVRR
jgi:hypothetical protein